jgi:hypothetical protein
MAQQKTNFGSRRCDVIRLRLNQAGPQWWDFSGRPTSLMVSTGVDGFNNRSRIWVDDAE